MKLPFLLILITVWLACDQSGENTSNSRPTTLPKTKNTMAWEQNETQHKTNSLFGKLDSNNSFSFYGQSVLHEKLAFNEIPFRVGVYHIGGSLDDKGDGWVGGSFTINKNEKTMGTTKNASSSTDYCTYKAVLEEDKDKNYMALTYVDAARRIVQGKFKVRFQKQANNQCSDANPNEIDVAEGAFALQLEEK